MRYSRLPVPNNSTPITPVNTATVMGQFIMITNPPPISFSLVAVWSPTAQVWSPMKNLSR